MSDIVDLVASLGSGIVQNREYHTDAVRLNQSISEPMRG